MTQVSFSLMRRGINTPKEPRIGPVECMPLGSSRHQAELSHHPEPCIYVAQTDLIIKISDNNALPLDALHLQGKVLL
jgi:hypothetical protein